MVFISCYFCFYYYIIFWNGSFWRAYKRRELSSQETVVFRFRVESGLLFPRFSFRVSFHIEKKKKLISDSRGSSMGKRLQNATSSGGEIPPEKRIRRSKTICSCNSPRPPFLSAHSTFSWLSLSLSLSENLIANLI